MTSQIGFISSSGGIYKLGPIPYDEETAVSSGSSSSDTAKDTWQPKRHHSIPSEFPITKQPSLDTATTEKPEELKIIPPGFLSYSVGAGQTLDTIALLHDTRPSYLLTVNKRTSRILFPGEVILVPDKDNPPPPPVESPRSPVSLCFDPLPGLIPTQSFQDASRNNDPLFDLPLLGRRRSGAGAGDGGSKTTSPRRPRPLSRAESIALNEMCAEKFLKIHVKHHIPQARARRGKRRKATIVSGDTPSPSQPKGTPAPSTPSSNSRRRSGVAVVEGTLLVTPSAVMFESLTGQSEHELIIPTSLIATAACFADTSHLNEATPGAAAAQHFSESSEESGDDSESEGEADDDTITPLACPPEALKNIPSSDSNNNTEKETNRPKSGSASSVEGKTKNAEDGTVHRSRSSDSLSSQAELPLYLRLSLLPSAARPTTPLSSACHPQPQPGTSPALGSSPCSASLLPALHVTGQLAGLAQYWFRISPAWVDRVYAFFVQWRPGEEHPTPEGGVPAFVSTDEDEDLLMDSPDGAGWSGPGSARLPGAKNHSRPLDKEWEILNVEERNRRQELLLERSLLLPDVIGQSQMLRVGHVRKLLVSLPSRCVGSVWTCVFNSRRDGLSLSTLYRNAQSLDKDTACLILVQQLSRKRTTSASSGGSPHKTPEETPEEKEHEPHVFGAMLSSPLYNTGEYYGTGQTCVFRFTRRPSAAVPQPAATTGSPAAAAPPDDEGLGVEVFRWTGTNGLFIWGGNSGVIVGGDDTGKPALHIDKELLSGRSEECGTFNNPILTQDGASSFTILALEFWAFVHEQDLDSLGLEAHQAVPFEQAHANV